MEGQVSAIHEGLAQGESDDLRCGVVGDKDDDLNGTAPVVDHLEDVDTVESMNILEDLEALEFVEELAQRCKGRRGLCGVTHLPHHRLSGRDESGSWWTKRAEPYPKKLVRSFAQRFVIHEALKKPAT